MLVSRERRESLREEECLKPKLKNCNRVTTKNSLQSEFQTAGAEHRKNNKNMASADYDDDFVESCSTL